MSAATLEFAAVARAEDWMQECEQIARALRRRDPAMLDQLIEQYQHRLYRYLLYLTRDPQLAQDIFQDTWIRVLERGSQYSARYKFETWLMSIARNLVIDNARRKHTTSFSELENDDEESPKFDVPDERAEVAFQQIQQQQQDDRLGVLLHGLPVLYREVLTLRFHEDLQLEEIAQVLHAPLSTVKSRLRRGLVMLQKKLSGSSFLREVRP
ncbi:MAG: sigma-70 family RNA polymerase sigma factor [Terriglobia bacterium]|nr:sigma-70 family RNA polymerase sigma factor [Terriglobia bacterium]